MEGRLEEMKSSRQQLEGQIKDKVKRNEELKNHLLALKQGQEKVSQRLERSRKEKTSLTTMLEERTATVLAIKQDSSKLRPYVLQSPAALQSSLTELSNSLSNDRSQIEMLDRRARALQTSTDTFTVVSADVANCLKQIEELQSDLKVEEEDALKAARNRDALSERGTNVREVERTEHLLQRQLTKWLERTEKLRATSSEKAEAAKKRTEELRAIHRKLTEERGEKGRDMERRRVRIEQTEKKVDCSSLCRT